ncbi:MAG: NAD(+) synthase [Candidatus Levybacteria bacterium]|nr:NAD(+) synthase [Candidatus Levybacteria bacterium]
MKIDPKLETEKITKFIRDTLEKTKIQKVVLGLSGGIDSATSLYLLKKSIPVENIIVSHLYYYKPLNLELLTKDLPKKNVHNISIKKVVDDLWVSESQFPAQGRQVQDEKIRFGNIAARVRMIILFDLAKKNKALVCGTENRSEHLLGYFTRFGDQASDFEPIRHLYKNQVLKLAKHLGVPKKIIKQRPTAGLWIGQTDENELGFTYEEADRVLNLYFDKKIKLGEIEKKGFKNTKKIIEYVLKNKFKRETPYSLKY